MERGERLFQPQDPVSPEAQSCLWIVGLENAGVNREHHEC